MEKGDVKKASALMMSTVFIGFLVFFVLGYLLVMPDHISPREKRALAPKPKLSFSSVRDGSYEKGLEEYLSDHILLREGLVTAATELDYYLGRRASKNVYYGSNGMLFLRPFKNDYAIKRTMEEYSSFAESVDVPVDFLLIPTAISLYPDELPFGIRDDIEKENMELMRSLAGSSLNMPDCLSVLERLRDSGEQVYLNTDHHWTIYGAKAILEEYLKGIGRPLRDVQYEKRTVTGYFGTLFANFPTGFIDPDDIDYLVNSDGSYTVEDMMTGEVSDTMLQENQFFEDYKYGVFFGGDKGLIHIHSDSAPEGSILVVKDSYGLAFMTLLADQYSDIYALDVRHYDTNEKSAAQLCSELSVERVLIINMAYSIINSEMFGLK